MIRFPAALGAWNSPEFMAVLKREIEQLGGGQLPDDPTPVEPQNEYCELLFAIDKATAETTITLSAD